MKILIAASLYPPEIAEPGPYVKELARRLSPNHELKVLCYANHYEKITGVDVVKVKKRRHLVARLFFYFLALLKNSTDADIIYAQSGIATTLPVVLAGKLRQRPIIIRFFEDEYRQRKKSGASPRYLRFIRSVQDYSLKHCGLIIASDDKTLNYLKQNNIQTPSQLVYNPAPRPLKFPFTTDKAAILIFLPPKTAKNTILASLKAIKELKADIPGLKLIMSDQAAFKETAKEEGLEEFVLILHSPTEAELDYWQKLSQISIIDITQKNSLHWISRAWQNRSLVLAKDHFLLNRQNSLLVASMNAVDIGLALAHALRDKGLSQSLRKNAAWDLENKLSWSIHLKRLEDIFTNLYGQK